MHGFLRCNINTSVHAHARSGRATQRCHNSPRWETGLQSANDVTHQKRAEDFGRIWRKLVELRSVSREDGLLSLAREALWQELHEMGWGGGRWKNQDRKIVPLSPYVEKPLNTKIIKCFVPEQRSPYVFFEFKKSYVLCYIYIYCMYMLWTSRVHFAYSCIWLWYINLYLIMPSVKQEESSTDFWVFGITPVSRNIEEHSNHIYLFVILRQTVSLYHNYSAWRSKPRSKPA